MRDGRIEDEKGIGHAGIDTARTLIHQLRPTIETALSDPDASHT